jgi:hypothetical protein
MSDSDCTQHIQGGPDHPLLHTLTATCPKYWAKLATNHTIPSSVLSTLAEVKWSLEHSVGSKTVLTIILPLLIYTYRYLYSVSHNLRFHYFFLLTSLKYPPPLAKPGSGPAKSPCGESWPVPSWLETSSFHTSQLVIVILTHANFRPHSCYWVISFSCYRPITERLNQSAMPNQIRSYKMHSGCRGTFKLAEIQQYWFSISLLYGAEWHSGSVLGHNPKVRGSKPRSANSFCICKITINTK